MEEINGGGNDSVLIFEKRLTILRKRGTSEELPQLMTAIDGEIARIGQELNQKTAELNSSESGWLRKRRLQAGY